MPTERTKRGERKREAIRIAAYRLFRDHGYHDTTVDRICQAAEISKGSFYWHYDSKQDVFIDILETWARQVMDELYEQFETAIQEEEYMTAITQALSAEIHRGRAVVPFWLEFTVQARRDPQIRDALAKFYRRARAAIAEILRPVTGHRLTEAELQGVAATIFGGYIGVLIQEFTDPGLADSDQVIRMFMSAVRWRLAPDEAESTAVPVLERLAPRTATEGVPSEIASYLAGHKRRVRELALSLRSMILDVCPEAEERIIRGWRCIAYDRDGLVVSIKPQPRQVVLELYDGASLPDPDGLLAGSGKKRRHIVLPAAAELDRSVIRHFLTLAFATS